MPTDDMVGGGAFPSVPNGGDSGQLFRRGAFVLHGGSKSIYKIDCDALSDGDIATLAAMASAVLPPFAAVEGVPTGGLRFARALERYRTPGAALLIADDVLTTGGSLERQRAGRAAHGVVLFARGPCPLWVTPLLTMHLRAAALDAAPSPHARPICHHGHTHRDDCLSCALHDRDALLETVMLLKEIHGDTRNRYDLRTAAALARSAPAETKASSKADTP